MNSMLNFRVSQSDSWLIFVQSQVGKDEEMSDIWHENIHLLSPSTYINEPCTSTARTTAACVCMSGCVSDVVSMLAAAEDETYVDLIILNTTGLDIICLLSHQQTEKNNYSPQPMVYFLILSRRERQKEVQLYTWVNEGCTGSFLLSPSGHAFH